MKNKDKFIDQLLIEQYGIKYLSTRKDMYIKEIEDTKETIIKAMKFRSWQFFAYGFLFCGLLQAIIFSILIELYL